MIPIIRNVDVLRSARRIGHVPVRQIVGEARDDMSAHILQDFLSAGFREVEWRYGFEEWQNTKLWREMGSVCPVCFALDGQRFKIDWLLQNMRHNAPKYTLSHVNCQCLLYRINRTEELLDFSEQVDVAPIEIDEEFRMGPIDLSQIPEGQREHMGLPPDANQWTDIKWQWDDRRNEFVPLKTILEEGIMPWIWDDKSGEFLSAEEWTRRYGVEG